MRYKMQPYLKQGKRVKPCANVIHHDSGPTRQRFQAAQRERLHYVKATKEYKTRQHVFPIHRNGNQRNHLAGDFINHNESGVFYTALSRYHGGGRNADQGHKDGNRDGRGNEPG